VVAAFQVWNEQVNAADSLKVIIGSQAPPELVITQKRDSGSIGIKTQRDGMVFFMYLTVLITNRTNSPNSVHRYEVRILNNYGEFQSIKVEQGSTPNFEYCVTPINIPGMSTVEAILGFTETSPAKYGQPFQFKITAVDMHGERFTGDVRF
jgi:hypothetical protein